MPFKILIDIDISGGVAFVALVDGIGIEPTTPAMSTQCSTAELTVRSSYRLSVISSRRKIKLSDNPCMNADQAASRLSTWLTSSFR